MTSVRTRNDGSAAGALREIQWPWRPDQLAPTHGKQRDITCMMSPSNFEAIARALARRTLCVARGVAELEDMGKGRRHITKLAHLRARGSCVYSSGVTLRVLAMLGPCPGRCSRILWGSFVDGRGPAHAGIDRLLVAPLLLIVHNDRHDHCINLFACMLRQRPRVVHEHDHDPRRHRHVAS